MILIIFFALLGFAVPPLLRVWQKERARLKISRQFRASLQNLCHALRVGVGLSQALEYAAKEGEEPLAGEWRRLLQAVQWGESWAEALVHFTERVPMKEAAAFATAVRVTQSTGGSLAEVLEILATSLQEQESLREKIKALTAQGKASGILLSILPYALLGVLLLIAPEMGKPFFQTTIGQWALVGVTLSLIVGGFVIKKIVTIEVN